MILLIVVNSWSEVETFIENYVSFILRTDKTDVVSDVYDNIREILVSLFNISNL